MTQKANAPVFVLIILLIISLSVAGGGFYLFQKERLKAMDLQTKLQELTEKERITSVNLEQSKKAVNDLQTKLQDARTLVDKVSAELQQEKSITKDALSKAEGLKAQLEKSNQMQADLEKKATQAQADAKRAADKLKELQAAKDQLEERLKKLSASSTGVELGNIVVSPESQATPAIGQAPGKEQKTAAGGLEGKVLVINKDYNFVVINLGSQNGIGLGEVFSVYHENKYIGDVKIEKVHESMAAAGFVSEDIKNRVSEGDRVVQKGR